MPNMVIVIFIAIVVLIIVLAIRGHLAEKKRREELALLAARLGFTYNPAKRRGRPAWGTPFELFRRANQYGTANHMRGAWQDLPVEVFDYTYYTESRDSKGRTSRHYSTRTVAAFEFFEAFPGLVIKPDSALREFFEFLGGHDIDFESDEFNKRYYVKADDRKFAYDVVHPRMMEFLLRVRGIALQIVGRRAIVFREKKLKPVEIEPLLAFAAAFYKNIPDFVKKDYATR